MYQELPEERLLNLIKGKNRGRSVERSMDLPAKIPNASAPDIMKVLSKIMSSKSELLKTANRYLLAVLIAVFAYAAYAIFSPAWQVSPVVQETSGRTAAPIGGALPNGHLLRPKLGDYPAYAAVISSRSLFKTESAPAAPAVNQSASLLGKFNLVGIMPGDRSQAIIEDKQTMKTYYLFKGDSFDGAIVEDIGDGRVVLESGGERVNLVL